MPLLSEVAARVVASPNPVVCIDTCDILEVVQCLGWRDAGVRVRDLDCVEFARGLLTALKSGAAHLVVTQLVRTEWADNIGPVRDAASKFLRQLADAKARVAGLTPGTVPPPTHVTLVDDLAHLSESLLNQATAIDLDPALVGRAVERVLAKRRPSHAGHLKDSIHLEHYLELARGLRAAGFAGPCVFVSGNRRDFGLAGSPAVHPDLAPEFAAAGLDYRGSIAAATGPLRL